MLPDVVGGGGGGGGLPSLERKNEGMWFLSALWES